MTHLLGTWSELGWAALKAVLLFVIAVVGLRLSERRVLGEFNAFDLVVLVSVGAIIGRTVTAPGTSFTIGAVALVVLLALHRLAAGLRRRGWGRRLLNRPPLVLLANGRVRPRALLSAGLTECDMYRLLRETGHHETTELQLVLYENTGRLTVVRRGERIGDAVAAGLAEAGESAALSPEAHR